MKAVQQPARPGLGTNPLSGKRVLVTRPREQADDFMHALERLGAVAIPFPTIDIAPLDDYAPLDQAINVLDSYRWVIFTSANGMSAFWQRLRVLGKDQRVFTSVKVAAIGPVTARALQNKGVHPDFVPQEYVAEKILPGLGNVSGQRILLPRAEQARQALVNGLRRLGAYPEEIPAYRTVLAQPDAEAWAELARGVDIATFTSSSTVKNFFELLGARALPVLEGTIIACIGPITAETSRSLGLTVSVIADQYTTDGLTQTLIDYYQSRE